MTTPAPMHVEGHFDPDTWTVSYLVLDPSTLQCALIDSVLDYDAKAGRTGTRSADKLIARVRELGASVQWILETHAHADHLTAAPYLQDQLGGKIAIGAHITAVQKVFGKLFHAGADFLHDGSQFDHLFRDEEHFLIGTIPCRVMHTPGHTPACLTYVVGEGPQLSAFVGDTLFMPDYGTARCDFPGGDARTLFQSINKVLSLPADTRLYMCHDYLPGGREVQFVSTVADERTHNIHVRNGITESAFVAMRTARDATLAMPTLILPSVQVNMRAGHMPEPEANGVRYLKIPLNQLG
ncbi:MAG: glyoxylase-like metal-dependent hydrolase (beta-lactamase superfamily II) [Burkholderiaceae bacterium]|jgi:glyoxylase-like metal-dependent hydrolase (beta-lactamase superfamily II)